MQELFPIIVSDDTAGLQARYICAIEKHAHTLLHTIPGTPFTHLDWIHSVVE